MVTDPNEKIALDFGAQEIIDAMEDSRTPSDRDLSRTLLLMMLPKKNHKKAPFWTDSTVFMQKMADLINRFPKVEESMKLAVEKDSRLTSYAGAFGVDFSDAIKTLSPLLPADALEKTEVKAKDLTAARFKNVLRNHYGEPDGPLPLQAIYNGLAKLLLQ